MSVLHVFSGRVGSGTEGITKNVEGLVQALQTRGHDAVLNSHTVTLDALNRSSTHLGNAKRLRRMLRSALRPDAFDVVHAHVNIASMGVAAPRRPVPFAGKRTPLLLHVWNALYRREDQPPKTPLSARLPHAVANGTRFARIASRRSDAVIVSSRFQREQLEQAGVRSPVFIVPNGIDSTQYRPATPEQKHNARKELGLTGSPVVLYYGHLSFWKGVPHLVEAVPRILRELPHAQVVFSTTAYGHGQERLSRRAELSSHRERVKLLGPSNVTTLLAAADVVVFPWTSPVGSACYPNVLLESMAAGVPVVGTRVGCVPEVIRDGQTGRLVQPSDPAAIAEAVTALGADEALRARIGVAARRTIEERFSWSDITQNMVELYHDFAAAATPRMLLQPDATPTAASRAVTLTDK